MMDRWIKNRAYRCRKILFCSDCLTNVYLIVIILREEKSEIKRYNNNVIAEIVSTADVQNLII